MKNWKKWMLFITSIVITVYLIATGLLEQIISSLGEFGIIGTLISGMFFGYGFTAIPATASLIFFTKTINFIVIAFIGAIGTMIGDLLIFHLFKDSLPDEIENLVNRSVIEKLQKSKAKWLVPGIAAFFIASPLPDEIGVALLGMTKYDGNKFMLVTFTLNFIGLLIITGIAALL